MLTRLGWGAHCLVLHQDSPRPPARLVQKAGARPELMSSALLSSPAAGISTPGTSQPAGTPGSPLRGHSANHRGMSGQPWVGDQPWRVGVPPAPAASPQPPAQPGMLQGRWAVRVLPRGEAARSPLPGLSVMLYRSSRLQPARTASLGTRHPLSPRHGPVPRAAFILLLLLLAIPPPRGRQLTPARSDLSCVKRGCLSAPLHQPHCGWERRRLEPPRAMSQSGRGAQAPPQPSTGFFRAKAKPVPPDTPAFPALLLHLRTATTCGGQGRPPSRDPVPRDERSAPSPAAQTSATAQTVRKVREQPGLLKP